MLQRYQQTKQLTINKKTSINKKFEYIDTLRQDVIIWFVDIMRQHFNLNNESKYVVSFITLTVHQNIY